MSESSNVPVAVGDVLAGRYAVDRVIGAGGMGVVVAAHHIQLGGRVALKFVLPHVAKNEIIVARFLREARAATKITGEHVARVTDVGTLESGAPYMVMEYLDGLDLGALIRERGPLSVVETVDYVLQALEALARAHSHGIVHRDIKPSNLFLTRRADGSPLVKVLDFGIAKAGDSSPNDVALTTTAGMIRSPAYMSPEQVRSAKNVDARSDIWSVGVVIHELLTRRYPFPGETMTSLLASVVADPPEALRSLRPDVPEGVERAVLRCLDKNVATRFPNVAELAAALVPFGSRDARLSLERVSGVLRVSVAPWIPSDTVSAPTEVSATAGNWTNASRGSSTVEQPSRGPLIATLVAATFALLAVASFVIYRHHNQSVTSAPPGLASVGAETSAASIATPTILVAPSAAPLPSTAGSDAAIAPSSNVPMASAAPSTEPRPSAIHTKPVGKTGTPGDAAPTKAPAAKSMDSLIDDRR